MRTRICAELGTAHHGDYPVAVKMVRAAAEAGCDAVKVQCYRRCVNPRDPQAQWLNESRLSDHHISAVRDIANAEGLEFWATPFDRESLEALVGMGVDRIKIASSESQNRWWAGRAQVVSWPWGIAIDPPAGVLNLTAVPLYPCPLEAIYRAPLLDGYSDHCVGLSACQYAIVKGAQWVEAHLALPGVTRHREFEKTPEDFRALRQFAEDVQTFKTGVGQVFRNRWIA